MSVRSDGNWQGMNWIRQDKRLAIYLRDGCACVWCGAKVEDGAKLTLDHLVPHSKGGSNEHPNLVTACHRCNTSRGARNPVKFAKVVAEYLDHGVDYHDILKGIRKTTSRSLTRPMAEAKVLIARRGSAFAALQPEEQA